MIKLTDVGVCYGENTVYDKFNFEFGEGVNVVLGKSGCGKTTLLNVVANLVDYVGNCEKDGKVAIVFQQPCLAPVSVWKNVDAVLPKGNHQKEIDEILADVEMSDKRNRFALSLSGGEQQRVALARAFATHREILLLDEPFSQLDYGVKTHIRSIFSGLVAKQQKTVLLVTHDIDEALALADRIYLMKDKPAIVTEVAKIDTPREQRDEYDPKMTATKQLLQELLK